MACVEIQEVIPFDETAGVFTAADCYNLAGWGKNDACTSAYNGYYRTIRPHLTAPIIDWRKYDLEYAIDFMLPNGLCKTLRYVDPTHAVYMCIKRSRRSPDFNDTDVAMLSLIDEFLNSFGSSFERIMDADRFTSVENICERFASLSRREAEVCSLLARRLSTAEVASRLFISQRTVENHVASVFEKLDLRSREQLRSRLGVFS